MRFIKVCVLIVVPLVLLATLLVFVTRASPFKLYIVHNGSMSPTIASGSAVIVWKGQYQLGQIITFTENGQTVTHRLISINAQGLTTTKGDANATVDPWHVPKKQIIGGVVMAPRYLGDVITFVRKPVGLGSIFLVILVIMMIWKHTKAPPSDSELDKKHARRRARKSAKGILADQPNGITAVVPPVVLVGGGEMQAEPAWGIVTHDERRSDLAVTLIDEAEQPPVPLPDDNLAPHVGHEISEGSPAIERVEVHAAQPAVLLIEEVEMTTQLEYDDSPSPQMMLEPPEWIVPTRPVEVVAVEPAATHVDDEKIAETATAHEVDVEEIRRARMAKLFGVVQK